MVVDATIEYFVSAETLDKGAGCFESSCWYRRLEDGARASDHCACLRCAVYRLLAFRDVETVEKF